MQIKIIVLSLIAAFSQSVFSQCAAITVQAVANFTPLAIDSLLESDGLRNGPDYKGATLFYPSNANKNLTSIVLIPGYLATEKSIKDWAKYFASRGFICMTIGTNQLGDNPSLRASALIDGMETLRQENERTASPLYQKIDKENIAVGGWSMGGGGAQLAAKIENRIKAVFAIAPWLGRDVSLPSDLEHTAPVLILSGQIDPTAPPATHANLHYSSTPDSTKKLVFEITAGNHYTPLNPNTGNGDAGNVAFAWLKLFLDNDACYCNMLAVDSLNQNSTASKYETNLTCPKLPTIILEHSELNFQVFPNPTSDEFVIEFSTPNKVEYNISDINGKIMKYGAVSSGEIITIKELSTGTYYLKVEKEVTKLLKN